MLPCTVIAGGIVKIYELVTQLCVVASSCNVLSQNTQISIIHNFTNITGIKWCGILNSSDGSDLLHLLRDDPKYLLEKVQVLTRHI